EKNNHFPWWMFGIGLMAYGCFLAVRDPSLAPVSRYASLPVTKSSTDPPFTSFAPNASFDPTAQLLIISGEKQELTYRESQLLRYLMQRPNEVLSRKDIHDAVWGAEGIMVGRSLDVFVSRLRKKLQAAEGTKIQTVHGVGYRFRTGESG
ncbi:MAG: winged helix-turn-helix domain-containing protein, partial [Bacteroidota bacterium]